MSRRPFVAIVVVCLAAVGAFFLTNRAPRIQAKPAPTVAVASANNASASAPSEAAPAETRVRRLSTAEHQKLAERIAAARARAREATPSSSETPALPADDSIQLEQVSTKVRTSLDESIPILAECFHDKTPKQTAVVVMTMYSDPSVGMVIDTGEMKDGDGKSLPAELDDCLRTTIETLALPPLEVGGHLPLQYSFVF